MNLQECYEKNHKIAYQCHKNQIKMQEMIMNHRSNKKNRYKKWHDNVNWLFVAVWSMFGAITCFISAYLSYKLT